MIQREYDSRGMLTKTTYSILGTAGTDPQPYKIEEQVVSYY
jgi:hypothetical protein